MAFILNLLQAAGLAIALFGLQSALLFPCTLLYERRKRRFMKKRCKKYMPSVSVIIPAYNEGRTIVSSVESVIASDYPDVDIIVVNDGSTDDTEERLRPFIASGTIRYIRKANGGKGSALNAGAALARGTVLIFTDADSLFCSQTIRMFARWFADPKVHAVCGNDTPIEPETALQKLLTVTTHIGTGYVRRALSALGVLPIISGNSGAVRATWFTKAGGFGEMWGEDLDFTLRLHRVGARIVYDSDALVLCDVPRTAADLWHQRVRWTRSYLKVTRLHADMMFNRRFAPLAWYLPINWLTMIGVPLLQLLTVVMLPVALSSAGTWMGDLVNTIGYFGIGSFLVIAAYSIVLDREFSHMRYLPTAACLIVPVSFFYNAVVVYSLYAEARQTSENWRKIERRSGVRTSGIARRVRLGIGLATVAAVAGGLSLAIVRHGGPVGDARPADHIAHPVSVTVATHADAWADPENAMRSLLAGKRFDMVQTIAASAGRYEWNYFRWRGHEDTWSNDQRGASVDLLSSAIAEAGGRGRKVIAIVDLYAPAYLGQHPETAARDAAGAPSPEQVCFMELVQGAYGRNLLEMVSYLVRSYSLKGISITEAAYNRFCYDDRCLASFAAATGSRTWPTGLLAGSVERGSEEIGAWRSRLMAGYLQEMADTVHAYGKEFFVDVPANAEDLDREGAQDGLRYPDLLRFVDGLVVWDYFAMSERSPESSEALARFFVDRYGPQKSIMSIGLWGKDRPVNDRELGAAVVASIRGGARRLWVTPNHLMTDAHWESLGRALAENPNFFSVGSNTGPLQSPGVAGTSSR